MIQHKKGFKHSMCKQQMVLILERRQMKKELEKKLCGVIHHGPNKSS